MQPTAILFTLLLLTPMASAAPAVCRGESGERLVPLVELYTSEGCDSCPPADRWLSARFTGDASAGAVPLAFHVDYWDRLGWKDRFASPHYTARQQAAMRANGATFVYTPQVLLHGRDFREWRGGSAATAIAAARSRIAGARIDAAVTVEGTTLLVRAEVELAPAFERSAVVAFAYVDSGLVTQVRAGENRGERLVHDHVVRAFETQALAAPKTSVRATLQRPAESGTHPRVVVFVQDARSGEVAQALAVPLAGC